MFVFFVAEDCKPRDRQWIRKLLLEPISFWIFATRSHRKVQIKINSENKTIIKSINRGFVVISFFITKVKKIPCSAHSQNDALSSSDSDGSCSNLQTAVATGQRWLGPQPSVQTPISGAAAVELWVESTTKAASVELQGE